MPKCATCGKSFGLFDGIWRWKEDIGGCFFCNKKCSNSFDKKRDSRYIPKNQGNKKQDIETQDARWAVFWGAIIGLYIILDFGIKNVYMIMLVIGVCIGVVTFIMQSKRALHNLAYKKEK